MSRTLVVIAAVLAVLVTYQMVQPTGRERAQAVFSEIQNRERCCDHHQRSGHHWPASGHFARTRAWRDRRLALDSCSTAVTP